MQNANQVHENNLSFLDKIALFITTQVGTMGFFFVCNLLVLASIVFPRYLLIIQFISSAWLQLVLLPVLAVGQNLQSRHSEIRAELDYNVNMKAEQEIQLILEALKRLEDK